MFDNPELFTEKKNLWRSQVKRDTNMKKRFCGMNTTFFPIQILMTPKLNIIVVNGWNGIYCIHQHVNKINMLLERPNCISKMRIQKSIAFIEGKTSILLTLLFFSLICANYGCSALNGIGSTDNDASSTNMMENDPNTIMPQNKQEFLNQQGILNSINDKQGSMNVI